MSGCLLLRDHPHLTDGLIVMAETSLVWHDRVRKQSHEVMTVGVTGEESDTLFNQGPEHEDFDRVFTKIVEEVKTCGYLYIHSFIADSFTDVDKGLLERVSVRGLPLTKVDHDECQRIFAERAERERKRQEEVERIIEAKRLKRQLGKMASIVDAMDKVPGPAYKGEIKRPEERKHRAQE